MSSLQFNQEASALNVRAIELAQEAKFPAAYEAFFEANDILDNSPESIDLYVQRARILCDIGFTAVREGVDHYKRHGYDDDARRYFRAGESTIVESINKTEKMLSEDVMHEGSLWVPTAKQSHGVASNHMASLTVYVRGRHAHNVAQGLVSKGRRGHATTAVVATLPLGRGGAYDFAREADDGYYRVDTPFTCVRVERANGRLLHVFPWLYRGAKELVWTAINDRESFVPAVKHAGRLSLVSLTRERALENASDPARI